MTEKSKFKNVFGEQNKEKWTYFEMNNSQTEGRPIAANKKFFVSTWDAQGGCVAVFDQSKPDGVKPDWPLIRGHQSAVLDLEFSPFSPNLLATGSDDCTIKLWQIPDGGLTANLTKEAQSYQNHTKKVCFVSFNPVASDVMLSAAADNTINVWNYATGSTIVETSIKETPTSCSWSPNGTLIGCSCKNKTLNIFDPRAKKFVLETVAHDGAKSQKFVWLNDFELATMGFAKNNAKELKRWDMRKVKEDLTSEGAIETVVVDHSTTIATPFVDRESKLIFTVGKGEGLIHVYDYNEGSIKKGLDFTSSDAATAICMFDRKGVNFNKCEVDKFAKVMNNKTAMYVSFFIPRKLPKYEPDLYPELPSGEPAQTYDQWMSGETKDPIKKKINEIGDVAGAAFVKKEGGAPSDGKVAELEKKVADLEAQVKALTEENEKLKADLAAKSA